MELIDQVYQIPNIDICSNVFIIDSDGGSCAIIQPAEYDERHYALMAYLFTVDRESDYRLPLHEEMRKL